MAGTSKTPSEKKKTAAAAAQSSRRAAKPKSDQAARESRTSPESFHDRLQKRFALYEPEKVDAILELISIGETATKACNLHGIKFPTFVGWVRADDELDQHYGRARELGDDAMEFEILDDAANDSEDWIDTPAGKSFNKEAVARSKLKVATKQWYLGKRRPKSWGDRLDLNVSGSLEITTQSDDELNSSILALTAKLDKLGGAK